MRRRRKRLRYIGVMAATVFLGGFTLSERSLSPEPELAGGFGVPAARDTIAPAWEHPDAPPALPASSTASATSSTGAAPPDTVEPAAPPPPPPKPSVTPEPLQTVEAQPGDTPVKLLTRMGVAPADAQAAIRKLSTVWDPRDLRAGQKAAVLVQSDRLLSIRLALAPDRDVVVARDDSGEFVAEDQDRPTHEVEALGAGKIRTSLSAAARRTNVPAAVLDEMVRAFSYDVDFQREVRQGDTFTVLYKRIDDEFGHPTNRGSMMYGEMVINGTRLRLYRFTSKGGEPGYYNALGENIRKSLLRTPIDGARLTSGFGMRWHPILGYSRMHQGVDFAAPSGTAIYAAGDGVVTRAGPSNGYGNYVEIEHAQGYATGYGHMSGFAAGIHDGVHVRQGEVIGYVGMTGMATGPHLHYEVHVNGDRIDPLSVKMPAITKLAVEDLKAFEKTRDAVDTDLVMLRKDLVAGVQCRDCTQTTSEP